MKGVKTNSAEASAQTRAAKSPRSHCSDQRWRSQTDDRPSSGFSPAVDTSVASPRSRYSLAASFSGSTLIQRAWILCGASFLHVLDIYSASLLKNCSISIFVTLSNSSSGSLRAILILISSSTNVLLKSSNHFTTIGESTTIHRRPWKWDFYDFER